MVFSLWEDKRNNSLTDLLNKVVSTSKNDIDSSDNSVLNETRIKLFEDNQFIDLSNNRVEYNYIYFSYEFVKKGKEREPKREDRVGESTSQIIVFANEGRLYYLIDKSYSNKTLSILRRMLNYTGKNEIKEHRFSGLKSDIFIWSLYRLLKHNYEYIDIGNSLKLETLVGFKGETEDKMATISGTGRRVINLLTTLLFLFENKDISKVELTMDYRDEKFKIMMGENSFIDVDFKSCLINDIVGMDEEVNSKILLKIFIEVLPLYIHSFSNHIDKREWNAIIRKRFFKGIGKDITTEIKNLARQI